MDISCVFVCLFAVLTNKVSSQETVTADIGGSVLLPCSSSEHDLEPQDTEVHWRHNGGKLVYDIVNGANSLEKQDPLYKNRTECFPKEFERGNFSIKLNNLTHTDAGEYSCLIPPSNEQKTILIITESTAGKGTESTEQEKQGETEPDNVETSSPWLWVGIASVIIVIVIGCIVACWIRKNSSSHRADRHDMDSDAHELEHMNQ